MRHIHRSAPAIRMAKRSLGTTTTVAWWSNGLLLSAKRFFQANLRKKKGTKSMSMLVKSKHIRSITISCRSFRSIIKGTKRIAWNQAIFDDGPSLLQRFVFEISPRLWKSETLACCWVKKLFWEDSWFKKICGTSHNLTRNQPENGHFQSKKGHHFSENHPYPSINPSIRVKPKTIDSEARELQAHREECHKEFAPLQSADESDLCLPRPPGGQ